MEGWQFFQLCGKHQDAGSYQDAYPRFAAEVEAMIAEVVGESLAAFEPSVALAKQQAGAIADLILEEVKKRLAVPFKT